MGNDGYCDHWQLAVPRGCHLRGTLDRSGNLRTCASPCLVMTLTKLSLGELPAAVRADIINRYIDA